jgi:peroxiredoxin
VVVLAGFVAGLAALVLQLIRQQGRVLIRLETLEALVGRLAETAAEDANTHARVAGLEMGSTLQPFRLQNLDGGFVGLDSFRGKRVLLTNWSTTCGWCGAIADDLSRLAGGLRSRGTELVLVSRGGSEANKVFAHQHGLDATILLADGAGDVEAFRQIGTPAAYLLDEEGRVAAPLALGATQVPALAAEAANGGSRLSTERPLSDSRIERHGLRPGTPAPDFELSDVRGGTVSLAAFRGQRVLVVFSDPACGPCDAVASDLASLQDEARASGLRIVLVGRGEPTANLRKARECGLEFPVVVQDRWKLSKEYGIFATPVAFLVDGKGVIAREVALGPHAIGGLAREALSGVGKEVVTGSREL